MIQIKFKKCALHQDFQISHLTIRTCFILPLLLMLHIFTRVYVSNQARFYLFSEMKRVNCCTEYDIIYYILGGCTVFHTILILFVGQYGLTDSDYLTSPGRLVKRKAA